MQLAKKTSAANRKVPAVQPTRESVVRTEPKSRFKKAKLFVILLTCFMLSLVVVAQYSALVILNYRLSSARTELIAVHETSRVLELEAARLGSVGRIEQIARTELGMVEPEADQLKVLTATQR